MSLSPRDHALRVAVLTTLGKEVSDATKTARTEAETSFAAVRKDGQKQQEVLLPDGTAIGLVSIRGGQPQTDVKNSAVDAWVREYLPGEFEDYILPLFLNSPEVVAWVKMRYPDFVGTRIRQVTKDALVKEAEANAGYVVDKESGEKSQIAEITEGDPTGAFSYRPGPGAREAILAAYRAGSLTGLGLGSLELGSAEPLTGNVTGPDDDSVFGTHLRPPFGDEHGFLNPELAAAHACMIQHGFSTPPVEAYRMLHDGGVGAERARAWLDKHGLDPEDPLLGTDVPWPLRTSEDGEP